MVNNLIGFSFNAPKNPRDACLNIPPTSNVVACFYVINWDFVFGRYDNLMSWIGCIACAMAVRHHAVIRERLTKTALPDDRLEICQARLARLANASSK